MHQLDQQQRPLIFTSAAYPAETRDGGKSVEGPDDSDYSVDDERFHGSLCGGHVMRAGRHYCEITARSGPSSSAPPPPHTPSYVPLPCCCNKNGKLTALNPPMPIDCGVVASAYNLSWSAWLAPTLLNSASTGRRRSGETSGQWPTAATLVSPGTYTQHHQPELWVEQEVVLTLKGSAGWMMHWNRLIHGSRECPVSWPGSHSRRRDCHSIC